MYIKPCRISIINSSSKLGHASKVTRSAHSKIQTSRDSESDLKTGSQIRTLKSRAHIHIHRMYIDIDLGLDPDIDITCLCVYIDISHVYLNMYRHICIHKYV